jgi:hypothetical protein
MRGELNICLFQSKGARRKWRWVQHSRKSRWWNGIENYKSDVIRKGNILWQTKNSEWNSEFYCGMAVFIVCSGITRVLRAHNLWTQVQVGVAMMFELTTPSILSTLTVLSNIGMWPTHTRICTHTRLLRWITLYHPVSVHSLPHVVFCRVWMLPCKVTSFYKFKFVGCVA